MNKLQEKIEASVFLHDLAQAIRRYRGTESDPDAKGDSPPAPRDDFQRLVSRLKRLTRR